MLFASGGNDLRSDLNDVWRLSDPAGPWTQLAPMSCSACRWAAVSVISDLIVVVSGLFAKSDMCIFNGVEWITRPSPVRRGQAAPVVLNNTLFIMGQNTRTHKE